MHPELDALLRYADGELDGEERRKLDKHLERCGPCRVEAGRLRRAVRPGPADAVPADHVLAGIRHWTARQTQEQPHDRSIKERTATKIGPYLGPAGAVTVLNKVSAQGDDLLSVIEPVLANFLGCRAARRLMSQVVEQVIMRP